MKRTLKKNFSFFLILFLLIGGVFSIVFKQTPVEALATDYWFNNAVNTNPATLGITNKDSEQIPISGSQQISTSISEKTKGRILLQTESKGETWYVDFFGFRHSLTIQNIVEVAKTQALGILNIDLDKIYQKN